MMNDPSQIPEPRIQISRPAPDAVLVSLGGEHDLSSSRDVEKALTESLEAGSHLIVNISDTEFIDSSTISALLRAKNAADAAGKRFNLVLGTAAIVERALDISGVVPLLDVVASVDAALAAV
jgi:anti-sigma B factor antagonist